MHSTGGFSRSPSGLGSEDAPPPSKRPKIYQACLACQRRKSRCEGLTTEGCARCIASSKACSLAVSSDPERAPALLVSNGRGDTVTLLSSMMSENQRKVEQLQRQLSAMDDRLRHIEGASDLLLPVQREDPSTLHVTVNTPALLSNDVQTTYVSPRRPLLLPDYAEHRQMLVFDEQITMFRRDAIFPHPVEAGILDTSQADALFQVFKNRFCRWTPLDRFMASSAATPSHGFLLLSTLVFLARDAATQTMLRSEQVSALERLLDCSMLIILAGTTSRDVALGLYILSQCPMFNNSSGNSPSPIRLIDLAHDIAESSGLAREARRDLTAGVDFAQDWASGQKDVVQLWLSIVYRRAILHLSHRAVSADDLTQQLAGADPSKLVSQCPSTDTSRRLLHEHRQIEFARQLLPPLTKIEDAMVPTEDDVRVLHDAREAYTVDHAEWHASLSAGVHSSAHLRLRYQGAQITLALAVRIIAAVQSSPTPVAACVKQLGRHLLAHGVMGASTAVLQCYMDGVSSEGPAWLSEAGSCHLMMAFSIQHEAVAFIRKNYPEARHEGWTLVEKALTCVEGSDTSVAELCRTIRARYQFNDLAQGDLAPPPTEVHMADFFDFAAFDWEDMASMGLLGAERESGSFRQG